MDKSLSTQTTIPGLHLLSPLLTVTGYPPLITSKEYDIKKQRIKDALHDPGFTQSTHQNIGVVMPFIVENKGNSNARSIEKPLGAITSVGYHALLSTESMRSFLTQYYGQGFATDIKDPMNTLTCKDRFGLVQPGERPRLEDCYYRMLLPHEVKLGMAFSEDYIVLGNSKEQVKQLGNAVTPPVMKQLSERCIETLK